ncbi:Peroxisomal acyl-coenzyme A oxidase 1 [Pseudocercospora fuligena]|uniref:Acyl-coenzyme A oxidase n=1 Tax=Pseudocercospora fuligena TaxID=685502 RepID=A0A8H6RM57_9PEZI|nr:Peroxisomal acyl-coenzyme A oxidase 1 [Pseudocercospora fuligena]
MYSQSKSAVPTEPVRSEFGLFLWGKEKFQRREEILKALQQNPIFAKVPGASASMARKDVWIHSVLQARELIALKLKHGWPDTQFQESFGFLENTVQASPQFRIFYSNLVRHMSDEQMVLWLPHVRNFEILGCYAQTELGHGSNVKGIETTATFHLDTDEFTLCSPTLSSTKYWIGVAGVWATHSIVVARLIINGTDHGNHLFLVQLRCLETHKPMPGVQLFDQGPKAFHGMLGFDNGAIRFENVSIPRENLLSRNAQVTRCGSYIPAKNTKHSYGSMITVRALMAEVTGWDLVKAVIVSYHYTNFRRQFRRSEAPGPEATVFEYASVQQRLLPLLAQATAMIVVGRDIKVAYDEYAAADLEPGSSSLLEDLHIRTVGAKVWATEITARGIEISRIACGGHGYSASAGFGRMYANAVNAVTYEGDNFVIGQQIPKIAMKFLDSFTMAHCDLVYWQGLSRLVERASSAGETYAAALTSLALVFSLSILHNPHHPSLVPFFLRPEERASLKKAYLHAINDLATHHVAGIVQAFGFTEYELDSALARADKSPYESLFEAAKNSELSGEKMEHMYPVIIETTNIWRKMQNEAAISEQHRAKL